MVIGALLLATMQAAPVEPEPMLIECVFLIEVPAAPQERRDRFAVYLPQGARVGPIPGAVIIDPAGLLRGGELDRVDRASSTEILLVGPRRAPRPFFTLQLDMVGTAGSRHAAIGFLDDNNERLGLCLTLHGITARDRLARISAPAAGPGARE